MAKLLSMQIETLNVKLCGASPPWTPWTVVDRARGLLFFTTWTVVDCYFLKKQKG